MKVCHFDTFYFAKVKKYAQTVYETLPFLFFALETNVSIATPERVSQLKCGGN